MKLTPAADRLLYSTFLGGATANCVGGSHCIPKLSITTIKAIVVDRNGIVTPGVIQTIRRCSEYWAQNGLRHRPSLVNVSRRLTLWAF
ncbi:MAG: hypothetical protein NTV52_05140 [Acidobacteria bacterium]|nr:hypothetical protein [Acidobacteriota bacterium]